MRAGTYKALFLAGVLLVLSGCVKRKPQIPTAQPPSTTTSESQPAQPPAQTTGEQPNQPASAAGENTQPTPEQSSETAPANKAKPRPEHRKQANGKPPERPHEKPSPEVARNAPPKIIIREGGTSAPGNTGTIAPGVSHSAAVHDAASTEQLLESTELNLRNIKRQLSSDEQATVAQIRDFMAQSKEATKERDLIRAHNLALKAHLLSDDLVKER